MFSHHHHGTVFFSVSARFIHNSRYGRKSPKQNESITIIIAPKKSSTRKLSYFYANRHRLSLSTDCVIILSCLENVLCYFFAIGGWTAIQLIQFEESKLNLETTSFVAASYKSLSNYSDHRQIVPSTVLLGLRNDMGFKQLRFYCHKKKVGTVVHIMTNISPQGESVVLYFIDDKLDSTRPQACNSYTVFPDDNSTISEDCSMLGWNGTHTDGKWTASATTGRSRIFKPLRRGPYVNRHAFTSSPDKRNCDGNLDDEAYLSAGDTWAVFVR